MRFLKNYIHPKYGFILLIGFAILIPTVAHATFVSPKRVMIDDNKRTSVITVYNTTKVPKLYTFSWQNRAQSPDGKSVVVKKGEVLEGYNPLNDMVMFSPRQVIVKPGESQRVRLFARRPPNLPDGEYHSHLQIVPQSPPDQDPAPFDNKKENFAGKMEFIVSMAIPVFVRQGETKLDFEITDATMIKKNGRNFLRFAATNNSTRSLYAKRTLVCTKADGTTEDIPLMQMRMYSEAKSTSDELHVGDDKEPIIDSCTSFKLDLYGQSDFEFPNKLIKSVPVTRG